jgi:hypothetical protein
MDRGAFDPKAKEDPSLKWLNESSTGVKFVRLQKPHIVAFFLSESSPLTTYRVSLINGQPTVETIEPANSMVYIIAGVFGSMAVMLAGVWLFRRQKVVPAPVA